MSWSKIQKANDKIPYSHITLVTPLGELSIEWKNWNESI